MIRITLAALLAFSTVTAPAWARDSPEDCATFGPNSGACRRGLAQRDNPARIEDDLRRARQEQRNHEHDQRRK